MERSAPLTGRFGGTTFPEIVARREALWDLCEPWSECLARLFDAIQEELLFQRSALGMDAVRAESEVSRLSPLERIAHKHLVELRTGDTTRNLSEARWLALMRELDDAPVSLEDGLQGKARVILTSIRRKGSVIRTWEEGYLSKSRTTLDDAKSYSLKREVTHALHNAAKNAALGLERIWGKKES